MDRFTKQIMDQIPRLISPDVRLSFLYDSNTPEANEFKIMGPKDEVVFLLSLIIQLLAYQSDESYTETIAQILVLIRYSRDRNIFAEDAKEDDFEIEDDEEESALIHCKSNNTGGLN